MKSFGEQMFWSSIYVTTPLAIMFGGAKWASILEADTFFIFINR